MWNPNPKIMNWNAFFRILLTGVLCIALALTAFFLIRLIAGPFSTAILIGVILSIALAVISLAINKARFAPRKENRDSLYRFFFDGLKVIIVITLVVGIWGIWSIAKSEQAGESALFKAIAVGIVIIWACIFLSYFVWAIYFYNINLGLTEEEWDSAFMRLSI